MLFVFDSFIFKLTIHICIYAYSVYFVHIAMAYVNGLFEIGVNAEFDVFHDHQSYFAGTNFGWSAIKRYDLSSDVVRGGGGASAVHYSIVIHKDVDVGQRLIRNRPLRVLKESLKCNRFRV